jgi:putative membrane protein insertion efficiency factor
MMATLSRLIRRMLMGFVRLYQATLSSLLPPSCRFVPTCSDYALEALERKPLLVCLWLIVRRLARCQPFCRGGFDPVPPDGAESPAKGRVKNA